MVPQYIFKTSIHVEFTLIYGVSWGSGLIFFSYTCPDLPTPLVAEAIFTLFHTPDSFAKY